jgi:hypothetical protein
MESNEMIRKLKIVVVAALILGVLGAIIYLIYGFTLLWTAMAAGIITGFLLLMVILFLALSIYLWTKNLIHKRDLKKYKTELQYCKAELKKMREIHNNL